VLGLCQLRGRAQAQWMIVVHQGHTSGDNIEVIDHSVEFDDLMAGTNL
jgi:hypothetical protein